MNMSHIIKKGLLAISLVSAVLLTLSCSSSSDLDFPDPNNADVSTAAIQSLVTGVESVSRNGLNQYFRAVGSIGREIYFFETADPRFTGELLRGPIDPGGFLAATPWTARYAAVKNCNLILERTAATPNAGASGFAKTMMAHELLMNLNYTDTNSIRIDVAGPVLGPVVTKAEALSFIASQLDSGYSDLGSAGGAFSFNLSSGFSEFNTPGTFGTFNRALRARVAAYQGDWQTALTALSASFLNDASPLDRSKGVKHLYASAAAGGDQVNPVYEPTTASTIKMYVHPSYVADAEAGDNRVSSKTYSRPSRTFDGLVSDTGFSLYAGLMAPIALIRNEELILLRAEANIHLNNLAAAEADINLVREAADLPAVILSADNAMAQLIHERRYSLFGEGHRWIDMRRWGLLNTLPLDREGDTIVERMPIPLSEHL